MSQRTRRFDLESLTPLHWLAIALALVSAAVHLVLGVGFLPHPMGVAFLLATAGFVVGVVLVLSNRRRRLVYLAGLPFVGVQILLWYLVNRPTALADLSAAGAIDKVAQVALLAALAVLYRRES